MARRTRVRAGIRSEHGTASEQEFIKEIAEDAGDARAYADLALLQRIGGHPDRSLQTLARLAATHPRREISLDIARQLEMFGDSESAAAWRRQAGVRP